MRISDWSSDVCSSDLFRKRKSPVRTALLITALSLSFAASTLQANEPAPRRASHGPIADAVADAGRTEANRARDSYRHPVETLSRSEEHTSELQSLMRISYAVFCLKKKKKCTITTFSLKSNT